MDISKFIAVTSLLTLIMSTTNAVPNITAATCELEHQSLIKKVLTLRKTCDTAVFHDCCQIKAFVPAARSTSYKIDRLCDSDGSALNFEVNKAFAFCDMDTDSGGWIVIQRRSNTSINFNQNWTQYENGFGDLNGDFWYGLKKINCLTTREKMELRVEIGNGEEPEIVWTYQTFSVGDYNTRYRITIGDAQGLAGSVDPMGGLNGKLFSTRDRSNIPITTNIGGYRNVRLIQCGSAVGAGWWFLSSGTAVGPGCFNANLNGPYSHSIEKYELRVSTSSGFVPYSHVQMKIRPQSCSPRASQLCA